MEVEAKDVPTFQPSEKEDLPPSTKTQSVRTYVFHLLETYVNISCNWLILWQNALYLYLGRSRMFLILQETRFQDCVLKSSSLSKKTSWKCKFIKTQQLHLSSLRKLFQPSVLDTCSIASRHLLSVEVYKLQNSDMIFLESVNVSLGLPFS